MQNFISAQMNFVSNAGDKNFAIILITIFSAFYLFSLGYKKQSALVIFSLASAIVANALKFLFKQPRPEKAIPTFKFDIYGFPSSHTLIYTVVFGFLIYLAFKLTGLPMLFRILTIAVSVYFISLVGISRVYLGQHYIWDVVAGYIFGALFLFLLIMLEGRWQ